MTVGVAISRTDLDSAGLRRAAAQSGDADAARRMLALALVLDGRTRTEAAQLCGMDRQTLRDWVHRYNDLGLAGLSDRVPPGAKPRLSPEQEAEVARLVREGPTFSEHGVVRWRAGSTCPGRSRNGLACTWRSGAWVRCCAAWAFAVCPLGRAIRVTTPRPRRHTKKFRRPRRRRDPRARARQAA